MDVSDHAEETGLQENLKVDESAGQVPSINNDLANGKQAESDDRP